MFPNTVQSCFQLLAGVTCLAVTIMLSGCSDNKGPAERGAGREVRVAAAANMKFAFDEVKTEFEKQHPDIRVSATYGSSGNFFAQLSNKAPFDFFLSADVDYPHKLVEQGLAKPESEFVYAVGKLVLWAPNRSQLDFDKRGMQALVDPSVRKIALASPRLAPYGRAAETALKNAGVYEEVKTRLVIGDNVEQAAQFVHSGAADAGFISLSSALAPEMQSTGRYWLVPRDLYPPLEQAGVILNRANDNAAAEALRTFLTSEQSRTLLKRHGYDFPKD